MSVLVLHLSDIHIRSASDWILNKSREVAAATFSALPQSSTVFIVVSGDIAYSGTSAQYASAKTFLQDVKHALLTEKPTLAVHFVTCPGNHDCDFSKSGNARVLLLDAVRKNPSMLDDSVLKESLKVQAAYREFTAEMQSECETVTGDEIWGMHRFTVEGKELVFDSINVAWCSNLREEPGSLIFPHERYTDRLSGVADLRVAVLHHPLNWFGQTSYRPFKELVRTVANVVISGHEHTGGVGEDIGSETGHSAYVEGCVLQSDRPATDSSFNVVVFDLNDGSYQSTRYVWDTADCYMPAEEGSWSDFRALPKKSTSRFVITTSFFNVISDPGGIFDASDSEVSLADLYVFPDMEGKIGTTEQKRILSSSVLLDIDRLEGGTLITGEEKVGATSLLFRLFEHFHSRGLVPVYVRGADLKGTTDRDVRAAISKAVVEQYGEDAVVLFDQTPCSKKLLLIDDFDDGPVKSSQSRASLLSALAERCPRFVVSASETFDIDGSMRARLSDATQGIADYKLLPMGFSLRAKLIRKWLLRTSADGSLSDEELLSKCDCAERTLDAVLARNIVPALPLYLLTLLQSLDAGQSGSFQESGLGEYYDYLIREGLRAASVNKASWASVIEYASQLAWQLHATEHKEISIAELAAFNERFSKLQHRVDLEQRLRDLVKARILAIDGEYVRFRYHYIYYFLKGRHLASQLNDLEVQAYIKKCCAHLYVRENANTVLFLAHHAFKEESFIAHIVEALCEPFKDASPVLFNGKDTEALQDFIRDLPKLSYNGEDPEKMREARNRERDRVGHHDGLVDKQSEVDELDYVAQLIALFKTVEILGQILKNQLASVPRARRVDLLEVLLRGPLRALAAYFEMLKTDKETVEQEIASMLERRHAIKDENERHAMAKRLLAQFVQMLAAGFVMKAVNSISSNALLEDIDAAAKRIDSPAARLIPLGVRLDVPGALPRNELIKAIEDTKTDFIAARVLQVLTLHRLYMFRTTAKDQQWLASKQLLDIKAQQAIDFRTRGTKHLK